MDETSDWDARAERYERLAHPFTARFAAAAREQF